MNALDRLILTAPIPHASSAGSYGTSATAVSGTSAATYTTTGSATNSVNLASTNLACCSFVTVNNLHASQALYVNVGNTASIPPDATAGSFPIPAGGRYTFAIPGGASLRGGIQGYLSILGSGASTTGSVQWHL